MATTKQIVTHEWVKITDGTKDQSLQFTGEIALCNSPEQPAPDAPAFRFETQAYQTLTIPKGDIAWARAAAPDGAVILLLW
ncbi:hypothetical protein AH140_000286 [Salmonella enterica subsp. enterica]|nr:hypothetical protein [Salmonella enterica subsp. enterica serovar Bahrenfeld]EHI5674743.1 hypothetical protein [Salmonella enterica]ELI2478447.1 hypothetical protein [Salmonella enterica]